MSATILPLSPDDKTQETVDFLRRLASMMTGGKNAEMLGEAAAMIEALTQRAVTAERLSDELQEQHERINELRAVAEIAAENLGAEAEALKAELEQAAEVADIERASLTRQAGRLLARAEDAENRLARVSAELDELRMPFAELSSAVVAVPVELLRTARAQFDSLADGFANGGDLISQTICEIGACAIDQALAGTTPPNDAGGEALSPPQS